MPRIIPRISNGSGQSMMKNEALRQQYLQELGVQPYFPRFRLPGAGLSPVYPTDHAADEAPPIEQDQVAEVAEGAVNGPDDIHRLLEEAEPRSSSTRPVEVRDAGSGRGVEKDEMPRQRESAAFAFVWVELDDRLAVLATMPQGHRGRLDRDARSLLQKILQAVHAGYGQAAMQEYPFAWPLDPRDTVADDEAARQAVQGFVTRRLRERSISYLLILADDVPDFLFRDRDEAVRQDAALARHPHWPLQMLRIPSLQAMEQDRALKKAAWQRLQQLIALLGKHSGDGPATH